METKKETPKKEEIVTLLPTDKFFKDMSSEVMSFYKKQLNFAMEINESIVKSISSIPSAEKMPITVFYKSFFSTEKMENPVFPTFLKMDGQQEAAEKLLKEISDAYNKQLDISIETNKELFSEFNNQFKKVIKTNEELLHLDKVA
jgi:ribosomal protein S17E